MSLQILYGHPNHGYSDVTQSALGFVTENMINLPADDNGRAHCLGDPLPGIVKEIVIVLNGQKQTYPVGQTVLCPVTGKLPALNPRSWRGKSFSFAHQKLEYIHSQLRFFGNIKDEYPEQLLSVEYITPERVVLEIGANLGRNTMVIASLLDKDTNLVTLECDPVTIPKLKQHRDINGFKFAIEESALSDHRLYLKDWETFYDFNRPATGSVEVQTISYENFRKKYPLPFDTLVLDCEGAFYYILCETPQILDGINLIIMENDYHNFDHKKQVDKTLTKHGFLILKTMPGGWGPCQGMFYQVWGKSQIPGLG